jgi:hypothetical protein
MSLALPNRGFSIFIIFLARRAYADFPIQLLQQWKPQKKLDFWYPIHSYGSFSVGCRSQRFLSPKLFTMFLKNTLAMANLLALTTALAVRSSDCTLAACAPYDTCYGLGDGGSYNIGGKEFLVALGVVKSTQTLVDLSGISHSRAAYQAARKMMRVSMWHTPAAERAISSKEQSYLIKHLLRQGLAMQRS